MQLLLPKKDNYRLNITELQHLDETASEADTKCLSFVDKCKTGDK